MHDCIRKQAEQAGYCEQARGQLSSKVPALASLNDKSRIGMCETNKPSPHTVVSVMVFIIAIESILR